jgi:hypothetical protein
LTQQFWQLAGTWQFPQKRRHAENENAGLAGKLHFARLNLKFRLLLGVLPLGDLLAKFTGMLSIEGIGHRRANRPILGVADHHPGPRDHLKTRPVQPN